MPTSKTSHLFCEQGRYKCYFKAKTVHPAIELGNVEKNLRLALEEMKKAYDEGVELLLFPSLFLTGNSVGAFLLQEAVAQAVQNALSSLVEKSQAYQGLTIVMGTHFLHQGKVIEGALVFSAGEVIQSIVREESDLAPYAYQYTREENAYFPHHFKLQCKGQEIPLALTSHPIFTLTLLHGNATPRAEISCVLFLGKDLEKHLFKAYDGLPQADLYLCLEKTPLLFATESTQSTEKRLENLYQVVTEHFQNKLLSVGASCRDSSAESLHANRSLFFDKGNRIFSLENRKTSPCFLSQEQSHTYFVSFAESAYVPLTEKQTASFLPAHKEFDLGLSTRPFLPQGTEAQKIGSQMISALAQALALRLEASRCKKMVLGLSGGLDSTLCLVIAVHTAKILKLSPQESILCVTMPGFGTSNQTYQNALALAEAYGVALREISIVPSVTQHLKDIGHALEDRNVTYENAQARERTQILMDLANDVQGLVLGTGDMSEIALGFCTYNGDHISMYSVNASVPKSNIPFLLSVEKNRLLRLTESERYKEKEKKAMLKAVEALQKVVDTPISPELLPTVQGAIAQKTEELLGAYELHDFFLYHFLKDGLSPEHLLFLAEQSFLTQENSPYTLETLWKTLRLFYRRFFTQQFKRACSPEGISLYPFSLSPRSAYFMPSDLNAQIFETAMLDLGKKLGFCE